MFTNILVPVDGSEESCHAVPYAQALLGPTGRLVLVRAAEGHTFPGGDLGAAQAEAVRQAEDATSLLCQSVLAQGTRAEPHVYYGPPATAICDEVDIVHADLIVMSTHARSELGKMVLASVAKGVVQKAQVPVLLVPWDCHVSWPPAAGKRVVVPLDGSPMAEAAIEPGIELARRLSAGLLLVGFEQPAYAGYGRAVYPMPESDQKLQELNSYLDEASGKIRQPGLACSTLADIAEPASAIADIASSQDAVAIVMATHGRSGLARAALGSVASEVVHMAEMPVLLVRPRP